MVGNNNTNPDEIGLDSSASGAITSYLAVVDAGRELKYHNGTVYIT